MSILAELRRRFAAALSAVAGDAALASLAERVIPMQGGKFGDYKAECAMPLGNSLGRPPRDVAAEIVAQLNVSDLCDPPEIAGPGFINLRLRDDWLVAQLRRALVDDERLGVPAVAAPRTFVVDFSAPNVAKPMHVGHIRSTVIGDALCRVLKFLGHRVVSDNHIGDWGTQFGMIIYGWKHFGDEAALAAEPVAELSRLYRLVNQLVDYHAARSETIPALTAELAEQQATVASLTAAPDPADPAERKAQAKRRGQAESQLAETRRNLADLEAKVAAIAADVRLKPLADAHPDIGRAVLAETAKLHAGDPENRALWERFLPACLAEIEQVYRRLGVEFDHTLGESFYEESLPGVVADLHSRGLARESQGAVCVFLDGFDAPFIVQKQDGAFLYATTDLATIQYRMQQWRPDAILYVVDHRQSDHFRQLFATARLWGYDQVELQHVSFGTVLGEDGRPFKTRSGATVGLMGLLD
ncbi:MAG TPA: arginine--tRNA ligase, partial [Lacipirellulaceae bacterium]|nr:arginine--tRNA ligase [Lacipirellulaceae bacterium]